MRQLFSLNLKLIRITKNINLKEFKTIQSILRSQKVIYQASITWFYRKAILKKKTLKSLFSYVVSSKANQHLPKELF